MARDPRFRFAVLATDPDWFAFLRRRPDLDEVNFWRPGGAQTVMARGTPWLFLIRGTTLIHGMGYFSAFSTMPIGVAWDTFGPANGFDNAADFRRKIAHLKDTSESAIGDIGCAVLASPQYFDEPIDFAPFGRLYGPIKSFETTENAGERLWDLVQRRSAPSSVAPLVWGGVGRKPVLVVPRIGQGTFRIALEREYEMRCAITGERTRPALEAAHIKPFEIVREHTLPNGLLLRSDIHKLFDQGYVTITPDRKFRVSRAIRDEFENGRDYYRLDGTLLREPLSAEARPAHEYLDWHASTKFKR